MPAFSGGGGDIGFLWRYRALGDTPGEIVRTVFTRPATVAGLVASAPKLTFIWQLLAPLGGLPLLGWPAAFLILPPLAYLLLSDYAFQATIWYHYTAPLIPFLFLATGWPTVLGVRFADRVGKAIRTPARDALLSTSVDGARKGWAFGVHRGMDRLGAVGGPLLALLVLHLFKNVDVPSLAPAGTGLPARLARHLCMLGGNKVRLVFLFSFIPAALALAFIPFTREAARAARASSGARRSGLGSPAFVLFLVASIVFTLGNSSNAFLILKAREAALPVTMIPVIWVVYNIACTISSPIFGTLSDRVGRAPVIAVSFIYYAIIYALFGFTQSLSGVWTLFAAYGLYYGLSEGVFRAYIADLVAADYRATAYGVFNTGVGLALVPASVIFGAVWDAFGSKWAFLMSAAFSLVGFVIFLWGLTAARRARGAGQPG